MKKYHKYIALAALICSFAACMQDEDFIPRGDGDAVKITATIGKLQTRVSYAERNTTFDENDQIKVVNKLRTSKNVATYTLTDEGWNTADAFVWNGASKNEFEAWYPVTDGTSFDTFTLPTEQNTSPLLGAADWMIANSGEIDKPEDQTLELYFLHRLSKVTVTIAEWNDEFGGTAQEVSTPKIYSKGTALTATYDDSGVTITATDGETGITPLVSGTSYTAIVAPAKYANTDKFMTFTVNGQEMTVLATSSRLTNEGLQAGLHYLFDLKVGKDAVTLYSVKVTPWEEKEIDGGVATEALSSINATAMTPDKLNATVTKALEEGETDITVTLKPDAPAEMITAIRRAICDTDGVADSSIHLTLKGVTTIPGTTNWDGVAFGPGDIYDEAGKIVDQELVTQLASINLPDVTEIGAQAFYFCENLVTVSAPKAQTIGAQALGYTALTSVEFPELTTIPTDMFSGTWTLSSAKFPKVTTIEQGGLLVGAKFWPENNPTPFPLELTAEGDITFNGSYHFNIAERNYTGKVDLVLNIDKKDQVTFHDDGTA
ncbi:MAG: fimbrillin family protein, partial [Bacteroidaceae bacterium]|nr:fimbrillin family protein [Bacteroidaceae bacterium]